MNFNDLKFKPHRLVEGKIASLDFANGYGVSVVTGSSFFNCDENTYEVAILRNGSICYDTKFTNDVLGYQTKEDISRLMKEVSEL